MSPEEAIRTLKWHADHSTKGNLSGSVTCDIDWETAYRTIFGGGPSYADLVRKIGDGLVQSGHEDRALLNPKAPVKNRTRDLAHEMAQVKDSLSRAKAILRDWLSLVAGRGVHLHRPIVQVTTDFLAK